MIFVSLFFYSQDHDVLAKTSMKELDTDLIRGQPGDVLHYLCLQRIELFYVYALYKNKIKSKEINVR